MPPLPLYLLSSIFLFFFFYCSIDKGIAEHRAASSFFQPVLRIIFVETKIFEEFVTLYPKRILNTLILRIGNYISIRFYFLPIFPQIKFELQESRLRNFFEKNNEYIDEKKILWTIKRSKNILIY